MDNIRDVSINGQTKIDTEVGMKGQSFFLGK